MTKNNTIQLNHNSELIDGKWFYFWTTLVWHTTEWENKTLYVNNSIIEF